MENKTIWIVNFHTAPPEYISQPRYLKLIPYLEEQGYRVTIFSQAYLRTQNISLLKKNSKFALKQYGRFEYVHIKSIKHSGNGFKRMFAIFLFAIKLFYYRKKFNKPDIIYHNVHMPFDFPVYLAALNLKAKYIVEAWDLWPEFFYLMGLVKKNNLFMKFAYSIEKFIYKEATNIVFTMEGGIDYLRSKKWDKNNDGPIDINKVVFITNGVDLKEFEFNKQRFISKDKDINDKNIFKVLYLGSIRKANNLRSLIDAANQLKNETDIRILIYGDGDERAILQEYCKSLDINNVIFKDKRLPYDQLPNILSKADVNIINYNKKFGLYGISSGKLPLYLASGKPIISNIKTTYCIIEKYNLGISSNISTSEEYANAVLKIKNMTKSDYENMCHRVKQCAKVYDYGVLSSKLLTILSD